MQKETQNKIMYGLVIAIICLSAGYLVCYYFPLYSLDIVSENMYAGSLDQCFLALDSGNTYKIDNNTESAGAFQARLYNISVIGQISYPRGDCQRLKDACLRAEKYSSCVWIESQLTCECGLK